MAAGMPEITYSCEICGLEGLNDDTMRSHVADHLGNTASCPFCDLTADDVSSNELLIHVNTSHLEYLTPENELFSFIDEDNNDDDDDDETLKDDKNDSNPSSATSVFSLKNNNNINNNDNDLMENVALLKSEGSPLRGQLKLDLKSRNREENQPSSQNCPLCAYTSESPLDLEEHINRLHFDPTSPSVVSNSLSRSSNSTFFHNGKCNETCNEDFLCPLCTKVFTSSPDLELHVNMDHRDILSPGEAGTTRANSSESMAGESEQCPVCCRGGFSTNQEMAAHIEEHFSANQHASTPSTADRLLAREMDQRERESRRAREQVEFEMLRAQFGMDNQGNFKEQSLTNMQRAVYAGEMSVADYYERQIELRMAEDTGMDDGSSCTRGLIPRIRALSMHTHVVNRILLSTTVEHYASTYGDRGWGCGYRNLQMMISSLVHHTGYHDLLYSSQNNKKPLLLRNSWGLVGTNGISMPSISRLQKHIEIAWKLGFDPQGADQLGHQLHNTRKWIGATEIVTLLSSLRIRCQLIDFHRPTDENGCHPELFAWVLDYFDKHAETSSSTNSIFIPPLYLQHQGHSRTIIGVEQSQSRRGSASSSFATTTLLLFDPSHSPRQMAQLKQGNANVYTTEAVNAMRLVRKSINQMKARQYQIVAVCGIIDNERDYQVSLLRGLLQFVLSIFQNGKMEEAPEGQH